MKKLLVTCLAIACFVAPVMPQDDEEGVQAVPFANSLSVHPVSLIVSSAITILPLMVYLTYEHSLKPSTALILTPNFMYWNLESGGDQLLTTGFGAGVGIRKYLSKPASGIYLQAKLDLSYVSMKLDYTDYGYQNRTAEGSGMGADVVGYVGAKGQWGKVVMFIDIGFGYQYVGASVSAENADVDVNASTSGLAIDGNFGLGYAF